MRSKYKIPKQLYGCPYCDAYSNDITIINEHIEFCPENPDFLNTPLNDLPHGNGYLEKKT